MSKTPFNIRIDSELKAKFSRKLRLRGETATDVVTRAIEVYCNDDSNDVTQSNLDNLESTNFGSYRDRALEEKIEQLESTIKQQQDEIARIGNLASSKASREEINEWLNDCAEDVLGSHITELDHRLKYHLEDEINQRIVTATEDILERINLLEDNQRDHAERLNQQDQRYQDNARDIGKLQDCYPELKADYKNQKEDIRILKHEVQTLKINRVTSQQHQKLQDYVSYLRSLFDGLSCDVEDNFSDNRDQTSPQDSFSSLMSFGSDGTINLTTISKSTDNEENLLTTKDVAVETGYPAKTITNKKPDKNGKITVGDFQYEVSKVKNKRYYKRVNNQNRVT